MTSQVTDVGDVPELNPVQELEMLTLELQDGPSIWEVEQLLPPAAVGIISRLTRQIQLLVELELERHGRSR